VEWRSVGATSAAAEKTLSDAIFVLGARKQLTTFEVHGHSLTTQELLAQVNERLGDTPGFLGSDAHLAVLALYAREHAPGMHIIWTDGAGSYFSPVDQEIGIERPVGNATPAELARLTAGNLVHEIAHARHTDVPAVQAFIAVGPVRYGSYEAAAWTRNLYNQLEDSRLENLLRGEDGGAADLMLEMYARAVAIGVAEYETAHGESPWREDPVDEGWQLMVALTALVLLGERQVVSRRVAELVAECAPWAEGLRRAELDILAATDAIYTRVGAAGLGNG
jgi:hypothetical protein